MVATPYDHTIYEVEGDMQDLANVEDSTLLDKKVVKRSTEATLVMDKDMTIEEELARVLNVYITNTRRKNIRYYRNLQ